MVQRGAGVHDVLDQLGALRGSLMEAEAILIQEALFECLSRAAPEGREEVLEEVWALLSRRRSAR